MDETSIAVLRSLPLDKAQCTPEDILERSGLSNKVFLTYFLCKLQAWGYITEVHNKYSLADKGLDYLRGVAIPA